MLRCRHCSTVTELPEEAARFVGWRLFDGISQNQEAMTDTCCPACTGIKPPARRDNVLPQDSLLDLLEES